MGSLFLHHPQEMLVFTASNTGEFRNALQMMMATYARMYIFFVLYHFTVQQVTKAHTVMTGPSWMFCHDVFVQTFMEPR